MADVAPVPPSDAAVPSAIAASTLGGLPGPTMAELLSGARRVLIGAGDSVRDEGEVTIPHLELVIAGLIRVYVSGADGRTMTVRYCRPGALIGTATLYAGVSRPFAIQAIAASEILRLRAEHVRALADRDVEVASALLSETSERVLGFVGELSERAFTDVRTRVCRHLLDLAAERQRGTELVAAINQQQLADAVGSVREVVVRVLRDLRAEGLVETGRHGIRILRPEQLFETVGPEPHDEAGRGT